jgi:hypothetical protein
MYPLCTRRIPVCPRRHFLPLRTSTSRLRVARVASSDSVGFRTSGPRFASRGLALNCLAFHRAGFVRGRWKPGDGVSRPHLAPRREMAFSSAPNSDALCRPVGRIGVPHPLRTRRVPEGNAVENHLARSAPATSPLRPVTFANQSTFDRLDPHLSMCDGRRGRRRNSFPPCSRSPCFTRLERPALSGAWVVVRCLVISHRDPTILRRAPSAVGERDLSPVSATNFLSRALWERSGSGNPGLHPSTAVTVSVASDHARRDPWRRTVHEGTR